MIRLGLVLCLALFIVASVDPATAQDRRPSHCIALVENAPGVQFIHKAAFADPLPDDTVRLTYVSHATFILQTQSGLSVATDYTGFLGRSDFIPTVVTMNHAHSSHWTSHPDPAIPHVLPGWNHAGGPIEHYLDLGELLVRNVSTDIRSRFGAGVEEDGNSIFVFEVAGLCIGHLGHLHHEPNIEQYAALGRLDVVMAPVDGGLTLDVPTMIRVLKRLKSSIVIPMHWFGSATLERFLLEMSDEFRVERDIGNEIEVSLRNLPSDPTIMLLRPEVLPRFDE